MSDKPMNQSRRDAVKVVLGGLATVPLMNLVGMAAAQAEELPHLDPATNQMAAQLKYVEDATAATERKTDADHCANCMFQMPESADAYIPCTLFTGFSVNRNGWCSSYSPRPAAS
ncbi:high-potential iron-sulfur protein [Thiorhodovibrio frisius]|uniref:High-potential iron-sulfur protein n=1 Tax=Thiorhodovibrio frisius TaxID=631362 RepID=H8Z5Y3_9GAMM|nr:high-potential iron-sulfur protein [Thiorhodovibrio frisius]EIC20633.1 High potential iron-sulfur protein [Thiorhodovibrio frisius]WPL21382.1 High-potential iron-sulfur protein precursor [Thiorhodovibrio frisius]